MLPVYADKDSLLWFVRMFKMGYFWSALQTAATSGMGRIFKDKYQIFPGCGKRGGGEDLTHLPPSCRLLCGQFALYYAPCRCTLLVFTWCIWTVGKTEQINVWWSRLRYVSHAGGVWSGSLGDQWKKSYRHSSLGRNCVTICPPCRVKTSLRKDYM